MTSIRHWLLVVILLPASALADSETIELGNGDKVTGTVVERTDEKVVLDHAVFGRIEIPLGEVARPEPPDPGLFGTRFLAGWKRSFSLGVNGQEGSSKTTDIRAALDADFEDATHRWGFDARYLFSLSDGDSTQNNAMASLRRDWLFVESRWFAFAAARFDYDDFRSWQYRIQGEGGVGYQLVERETFELRGRTGPSIANEWSVDQFRGEWLAGLEFAWKFLPNQRIEASNTFYYAFTPSGEFRNLSDLHWTWDLAEKPALSLKAGLENEYQSDASHGDKKNDLKYYTSIGIDF